MPTQQLSLINVLAYRTKSTSHLLSINSKGVTPPLLERWRRCAFPSSSHGAQQQTWNVIYETDKKALKCEQKADLLGLSGKISACRWVLWAFFMSHITQHCSRRCWQQVNVNRCRWQEPNKSLFSLPKEPGNRCKAGVPGFDPRSGNEISHDSTKSSHAEIEKFTCHN